MSAYQKARTLILESAAACKLPETDPRSVPDASGAFEFCKGYIRCADDAELLTEVESRELRQLLRDHHPASGGVERTCQEFKINPNDPKSFGAVNPGIEALKKLDARQVAMLDRQELELLREFMDHGRRQGVLVEFDTDTDVQGWAEMNSVHALEILAVANSHVRLRFS